MNFPKTDWRDNVAYLLIVVPVSLGAVYLAYGIQPRLVFVCASALGLLVFSVVRRLPLEFVILYLICTIFWTAVFPSRYLEALAAAGRAASG